MRDCVLNFPRDSFVGSNCDRLRGSSPRSLCVERSHCHRRDLREYPIYTCRTNSYSLAFQCRPLQWRLRHSPKRAEVKAGRWEGCAQSTFRLAARMFALAGTQRLHCFLVKNCIVIRGKKEAMMGKSEGVIDSPLRKYFLGL